MHLPHLSAVVSCLLVAVTPAVATTINQSNVAVLENFNTLTKSTGSVLPAGWSFVESGSGANETYGAGTGSSSAGNTYSFGEAGSTERAFGMLRTGSVSSILGTQVTNNTGAPITRLAIQYTGEQWRLGAAGRLDRLDFAYSLDATSLNTGTWLDVDALDFVAPVTSGSTGTRNGNDSANRVSLAFEVTGLNLAHGSSVWLRWSDFVPGGSNDGLAVDDFSITAMQSTTSQSVRDTLPIGVVMTLLGGIIATRSFVRRPVRVRP